MQAILRGSEKNLINTPIEEFSKSFRDNSIS